jgi:hypothetical protein
VSFASNPYPGDVPVAFPGTMAGLAPQAPRIPDYPFYVRAEYPTNSTPASPAAPGSSLTATAQRSEAAASARTGGGDESNGIAQYESVTKVSAANGTVTAVARSAGRSIGLGPLQIGSFVSTATTTLQSDGSLVRRSTVSVAGLTVDGQGVTVADGALVLAGTNVPLRGSPLGQTLTQNGLDLTYLAAQDTPTGLISEALVVRRAQATPKGTVTVAMTFGQAITSISGSVVPDSPDAVGVNDSPAAAWSAPLVDPPSGGSAISAPSGPQQPVTAVAPTVAVASPTGTDVSTAPGGAPEPTFSAGSSAPATPTEQALPAAVTLARPVAARVRSFDVRSSYLLVAAALVVLAAARLVTPRVRLPWNS